MTLDRFLRIAVGTLALAGVGAHAQPVQAWLTYTDRTKLLERGEDASFSAQAPLALDIAVDASQRYQRIVGFGANITDASAWLLHRRLPEAERNALMKDLFGPPPALALSFARVTVGASDFSQTHYTLADSSEPDPQLASFSIAPMRADVLPVVKQALALNPQLKVMASPWSAPAWMKASGKLVTGALRPDAYDAFARYLVRFADAMEGEGVPLFAVSVQNEPLFEPHDYPGMRVDAAARTQLVSQHLGPMLAQRKLPVQILEWDHNWDRPQDPLQVLADPAARRYIAGVAWHCYAGNESAQSAVHDAHPDKDVYMTECSGGDWKPHWRETLPWYMRHLFIGATRNWASGVLLWNLALDEKHGPHLGGCPDCRGVVTIDSRTGEVTRNFDYYALGHMSRFVRPGAQRIASTSGQAKVETVAFRNPDGSTALVVLNGAATERRFSVSYDGRSFQYALPGASVATFVWR